MKKVTAFILLVIVFLICTMPVFAEITYDYIIDSEGNITAYLGEYYDVMIIPSTVNDRKVKKLGDALFSSKAVNTVYPEEGIEEIGVSCFEDSNLDYIDIPASVEKVGDFAFKNCKNLMSMSIGSDKTVFGKDALAGTGFLYIGVPCTADLLSLHDIIRDAKGDDEFSFDVMHTDLVESMVEKDIFGHSMLMCNACGFKGSVYIDDIYVPFEDVSEDAWFYSYVLTAYEFGILNGKSETVFDPDADMTLAEAAKIAACLHLYLSGETADLSGGEGKWYQPYVDYCYSNNIIDEHIVFDWDKKATRAEMAYLFSRADNGEYEPNPDVPLTDIPDVDETTLFASNILDLYRRGIAAGSNEYYTFYPEANVKRSEAAAFISRIICYDMRIDLPKG